ncbi:MAG: YfhO family protein, partial [Nitrospinota bacterium]|nr:YfhO family protein [Nitrospinota bacterium]
PRAYLVPKMRIPEEGQLFIDFYDQSFDPLSEVLLTKPVEFTESPHFQGTVQEVAYSPNHVTVKTSQEGNGFLVLLDTYLHGWTVKVDGRDQPILQAYGFYRAVQLTPGEHTLEFDYFPEGFKEGLIVSSIFLLILIVLPLCRPITRLRFQPTPSSHSGSEGPPEIDTTPYN